MKKYEIIDGNEAAASVAYRLNEVIAIYPITPSSTMGELADLWASQGKKNVWGLVPTVVEMQSEGGAAGAVHGALQGGSLATTFTASQGLLLMIPNMYKIAGELTPTVFHVAARSLATHALSIFGDHSDVMSARSTGFAFLSSTSVQEAMDMAAIAQRATLESRIPFLHFFDGFRTSHEIVNVEPIADDVLMKMVEGDFSTQRHNRALSPDHPVIRGTAQNPDSYFQSREGVSPYYAACPALTQKAMDLFAELTGRKYSLYEYYGHPQAEKLVIIMGSGTQTVRETVDHLNKEGQKLGVLTVRLYRPLDVQRFVAAIPETVQKISVLDRTKEPGSGGEPLYLDTVQAVYEGMEKGWCKFAKIPRIVGGRYGLSSKEFTPAMVKAVYDNLGQEHPKAHFTVGISDDVSHSSLDVDPDFYIESPRIFRGVFYGLGADGTVSANKTTIKTIGKKLNENVQAYFVYDSRKSGAVTVSHLRFGKEALRTPYLITRANFLACHQWELLEAFDMIDMLEKKGLFLLNSPYPADQIWSHIPREIQAKMIEKHVVFYVINAYEVAKQAGLGKRISTIMQTCFFAVTGLLPMEEALAEIRSGIQKAYGAKGEEVVKMNLDAVSKTLEQLKKVELPDSPQGSLTQHSAMNGGSPDYVREVAGRILRGQGDQLPVSAFPVDGTYPTGTSKWEKRNLAEELPVWDPGICIQCAKCTIVCPHSALRVKVYDPKLKDSAPVTFKSRNSMEKQWSGLNYTIQVAPEDCTGCGICVDVCPVKSKTDPKARAINMAPQMALKEEEKKNWDFFLKIPEVDRRDIDASRIRQQQVQQPLFEFPSACMGCGETPYVKLLSQLFGDRLMIANATGCSSIYGGNLPTTPWTKDEHGRGPAWANSLFEDNAEFGLGIKLSVDKSKEQAEALLEKLKASIGEPLAGDTLKATQNNEAEIFEQRQRVEELKKRLETVPGEDARRLKELADYLVKKSVWIVGGDGWAYDIGYGGLDHVLASGQNVKILVLDTEVYSNTGGQVSKSSPRASIGKFAVGGKKTAKKDLGLMAMTYRHVYVASIALGAKDEQSLKAFLEAEAYPGPALIIAYSHCIAHGINVRTAMQNQKMAVDTGYWMLYRYNPLLAAQNKIPLQIDSLPPKSPIEQYLKMENRFRALKDQSEEVYEELSGQAQQDALERWKMYQSLATQHLESVSKEKTPS